MALGWPLAQLFKISTFQLFNFSRFQDLEISRFQVFKISTFQHFNFLRSINISNLDANPRMGCLGRLSTDFRDFLANCGPPCGSSSIEGARGWDRFWVCWGPSREGFWELFGRSLRRFGRSLHLRFVPSSSQVCPNSRSVVVLPLVPGLGCPALQLQGRWSRGAC